MLEQEKVFLKNIIDSVISLDSNSSSPYEDKSVSFIIDSKKYEFNKCDDIFIKRYNKSLNTKNYRFDISIHKIPIKQLFSGLKYHYYLSLDVRTVYTYTSSTSSMAQYNYYNEKGLELIYDRLESLYDTYKIEESSKIFKKFNEDLVTIIDKSLTRDSKLDELLDGK
jgi:hypothetical protein